MAAKSSLTMDVTVDPVKQEIAFVTKDRGIVVVVFPMTVEKVAGVITHLQAAIEIANGNKPNTIIMPQ